MFAKVSILFVIAITGLEACSKNGQFTTDNKIMCEGEEKLIGCPAGSKIEMTKALYGRHRVDVCNGAFRAFDASKKCGNPPKDLLKMKEKCDGQSNCKIQATNKWIGYDPCKNTFKYLEFEYRCRNIRCDDNPCEFNGTCQTVGTTGYFCSCPEGYTGEHCETMILQGEPEPKTLKCKPECQNGGVCVADKCQCFKPFSGEQCENVDLKGKENLCNSSPCQYGSTCHPRINGYRCYCAIGFWGKNCQQYNRCWRNGCQNGGICVTLPLGQQKCVCPSTFSGELCERSAEKTE